MKQYTLLIFTILILPATMQAQTNENIAGEYYLQGVMEVGSGFKLNTDSTFEFFFTYGALDRYGSGNWRRENDKIILNSKPYPGRDFKLVDSSSDKNNFITLKIDDKNEALLRFVHCVIKTKQGDTMLDANNEGSIVLPGKSIDTVHLLFELCPEKISTFVLDTKHNIFTFRFEPWIGEVFFKNFNLAIDKDHLAGKHPLLNDKVYTYTKDQ